jgi:hypothetical protein
MKTLTKTLVMVAVFALGSLAAADSAEAQDLEGRWQTTPGDEVWHLVYKGTDFNGVQHYAFSYFGQTIAGGGRLWLHPNGFSDARVDRVDRDFLGCAIPAGSYARGGVTQGGFYLDGFRLDGQVRRLTFR